LFVIGGRALPAKIAIGAELANCFVELAINDHDSKPIEITTNQWQFLRGVYAMHPEAPRGLPYGDNAVLAQDNGDSDGLLFFIDGGKPCAPMLAPPALLSLMDQVTMADYGSRL
jgi:hypothetical protein